MSIANSVVAEFYFGGPRADMSHKSVVSAISKLIDTENGSVSIFPAITVLYKFDDGSIVSVDERGVIDYNTIDDMLTNPGKEMST